MTAPKVSPAMMKTEFNAIALEDAIRAAVNVLRDSAESGRMPSGEALPQEAIAVHLDAADRLQRLQDVLRDPAAPVTRETLEC